MNFLYAIASGAVQRIGIFPPCDNMREHLPVKALTFNLKKFKKKTSLWSATLTFQMRCAVMCLHRQQLRCHTYANDLLVYTGSCSQSKVFCFTCAPPRWKPRTDLNWDTSTACGPTHNFTNEYQFRDTFVTPSFIFLHKPPVLTVGGPPRLLYLCSSSSLSRFHCEDGKVHRMTAEFQRKMCF